MSGFSIIFSLLNSKEFCAKAEINSTGELKTKAIQVMQQVKGVLSLR
jgi:hypothetical protein